MAVVSVLVLRAPGINCDEETVFAFEMAGAKAERVHIKRLIAEPALLGNFQILTIPGGFSYGDDIASGKILANQIAHHLAGPIAGFVDRGGLVLGICNGFQVLVRLGLLPGADSQALLTLALNDSGRFEDRWVKLRAEPSNCAFLSEGEAFDFPVAHAEGRVVVGGGPAGVERLRTQGRIPLRYEAKDGGEPHYPDNPNGSIGNIAALTDRTGRVFGLMPHPERSILASQLPGEIRDASTETPGERFFRAAVRTVR